MKRRHTFLPVLMTAYTHEERQALITRCKKWIGADGQWLGAWSGDRAKINMVTQQSRADAHTGRRKMQKYTTGKHNKNPTVQVCVTQVVLVAAGFYPQEDDEASHLCHDPRCILLEHLLWERGDFNRRRKTCAKLGECVCRQERKCLLDAHKK